MGRKYQVVPFEPRHAMEMDLQHAQSVGDLTTGEQRRWEYAMTSGQAWTVQSERSVCACAGVILLWPGRFQAWAILSRYITRGGLLCLHRGVSGFLDTVPGRVETTVLLDFGPGHRWAQMLGFVPEGVMRQYDHVGRDHVLYARISDGRDGTSGLDLDGGSERGSRRCGGAFTGVRPGARR